MVKRERKGSEEWEWWRVGGRRKVDISAEGRRSGGGEVEREREDWDWDWVWVCWRGRMSRRIRWRWNSLDAGRGWVSQEERRS